MKAKEILAAKGSRVVTADEDCLLIDAMAIFFANKIGSLLVVDKNDKILGIIAPNDILKAVHKDLAAVAAISVKEAMVKEMIVATPDDSIEYIQAIMTENRVRHIPILDRGKLAGLISIGDIMKALMTEKNVEIKYLQDYIEDRYPA
jgi:CBS domain-containing protein